MAACFFNSLPNSEYSNLFIVATSSNNFFSGETSFPGKNSCLPKFADDKTKTLTVCLSKSY